MMHAHLIWILIIQSAPDFLVSIFNISFKGIVQPKNLIFVIISSMWNKRRYFEEQHWTPLTYGQNTQTSKPLLLCSTGLERHEGEIFPNESAMNHIKSLWIRTELNMNMMINTQSYSLYLDPIIENVHSWNKSIESLSPKWLQHWPV